MKIQRMLPLLLAALLPMGAMAQGGISADQLASMRKSCNPTAADAAINNAIATQGIAVLAKSFNNPSFDTSFSNEVPSKGITNQRRSGRCWLFTGLNMLRSSVIQRYNLGSFEFSQNYCFFYDQLEKANLFLQAVIDNARKPMDDRLVEWLFKHPISDGGQYTGVADIIGKYGLVPSTVMPETYCSNNTSDYANIMSLKLREFGLKLRDMAASGQKARDMQAEKNLQMAEVYRILVRCFGMPPEKFTYTMKDKDGHVVSTQEYTPLSFYQQHVGFDLKGNYVMLMNDPTRPYYKNYEIDLDRHSYDGYNWTYVNLPMEDIKEMAIKSIKDKKMMYLSCDVRKDYDSQTGYSDPANYAYANLMGTTFPMNKEQRVRTFASGSSHAMTLMAVDLDADGKPLKWKVENSWGAESGHKGHIIMSDKWFDEYVFRLVVEKQYIPQRIIDITKQKPTLLPAWDPMFVPEE